MVVQVGETNLSGTRSMWQAEAQQMALMERHGALPYHSMLNTLRSLLPASVLVTKYVCVATCSSTQEEGDHRMLKFNKLTSFRTEA
jgi:hypothetical protein